MDMRLMKESIPMEQPVGAADSQAVVEGEIALPGGLREEARVLHLSALAVVSGVEALQDRASVTGRVIFHALYTQGDPSRVQAMEAAADFTHLMDLPGATPRCLCAAQARVEHTHAAAQGGRLTMRAVLRVSARGVLQQPVEALTGLRGVPDAQLLTCQASLRRTVGSGSADALLREEFALPASLQIAETLFASARAQLTDVSGGMGRAGLSGTVQLEAVHASDTPGLPLVVTRHTFPFEQSVNLTGESGGTLEGEVQVKDVAVVSQDTGEGERILRAEVLLGLQGRTDRTDAVTLLQDAYTTAGDNLALDARSVQVRTEDVSDFAAESGKAVMMLPQSAPPVRTILCAFATPVIGACEPSGSRLSIDGTLDVTLLYMTDASSAPVSVQQVVPFRAAFAAQAGDAPALDVSDVDAATITSDRVELKFVLHLRTRGMRTQPLRLITDAQPVSAPAPEGSIVVCFAQPGETLWEIARRYRTPLQALRDLNPDVSAELKPGQGVVVWNRGAQG